MRGYSPLVGLALLAAITYGACRDGTTTRNSGTSWYAGCPTGQTGRPRFRCNGSAIVRNGGTSCTRRCGSNANTNNRYYNNNQQWNVRCPRGQTGNLRYRCRATATTATLQRVTGARYTCMRQCRHASRNNGRQPLNHGNQWNCRNTCCPTGQVGYKYLRCNNGRVVEYRATTCQRTCVSDWGGRRTAITQGRYYFRTCPTNVCRGTANSCKTRWRCMSGRGVRNLPATYNCQRQCRHNTLTRDYRGVQTFQHGRNWVPVNSCGSAATGQRRYQCRNGRISTTAAWTRCNRKCGNGISRQTGRTWRPTGTNRSHGNTWVVRCPNGQSGNQTYRCLNGRTYRYRNACRPNCGNAVSTRTGTGPWRSTGTNRAHGTNWRTTCQSGYSGYRVYRCNMGRTSIQTNRCYRNCARNTRLAATSGGRARNNGQTWTTACARYRNMPQTGVRRWDCYRGTVRARGTTCRRSCNHAFTGGRAKRHGATWQMSNCRVTNNRGRACTANSPCNGANTYSCNNGGTPRRIRSTCRRANQCYHCGGVKNPRARWQCTNCNQPNARVQSSRAQQNADGYQRIVAPGYTGALVYRCNY